jgi:hypothetical protein
VIDPTASRVDAARVAILPLDCPTNPIRRLITSGIDAVLAEPDRFQNYTKTALTTTSVSATEPSGTESVQEAVTFAALAALRIQKAEPFR